MNTEELVTSIVSLFTQFGLKLIGALLLLIVGHKIIKFIIKKIKESKPMQKFDKDIKGFAVSALSITLNVLLAISAIAICGVPMASIIAALGTAGLAVGLSLQGSLSNFAGGIVILIFKPFHVGNYIDIGTHAGTVEEIGIFYTKIITLDNREVVIPNSVISNTSLTNVTAKKERRVDLTFSVSYLSDTEKVKKVALNVIKAHADILEDPAPTVRMMDRADSSLDFTVRAWCKTEHYWDVYFDLNEQIKKAFDENDIEIPFPQVDVHMKNN